MILTTVEEVVDSIMAEVVEEAVGSMEEEEEEGVVAVDQVCEGVSVYRVDLIRIVCCVLAFASIVRYFYQSQSVKFNLQFADDRVKETYQFTIINHWNMSYIPPPPHTHTHSHMHTHIPGYARYGPMKGNQGGGGGSKGYHPYPRF